MIQLLPTTDEQGFTLIEVLIAMVVLTIGIFSLFSMQTTSTLSNITASNITTASNWAMDAVEEIIEMDYKDLEDTNANGFAGLDDIAAPDDQTTSDDNLYTIFLNVAEDYPIEGCKTLRVHIRDDRQHLKNVITYEYIKEKAI